MKSNFKPSAAGWWSGPRTDRGRAGPPQPGRCTPEATINSWRRRLGRGSTKKIGSGGNPGDRRTRRSPFGAARPDLGERNQEDTTLPRGFAGRAQSIPADRDHCAHDDRRAGLSLACGVPLSESVGIRGVGSASDSRQRTSRQACRPSLPRHDHGGSRYAAGNVRRMMVRSSTFAPPDSALPLNGLASQPVLRIS